MLRRIYRIASTTILAALAALALFFAALCIPAVYYAASGQSPPPRPNPALTPLQNVMIDRSPFFPSGGRGLRGMLFENLKPLVETREGRFNASLERDGFNVTRYDKHCLLCGMLSPNHAPENPYCRVTVGYHLAPPRIENRFRLPGIDWTQAVLFRERYARLTLSYWLLALLAGFLPALALVRWLRRRHRTRGPGACRGCGYNLTGNLSGRCPECGRPIAAAA